MRKHYIDWLRNLGILYLLPFHTARLFDSMEPNYIKGETSLLCDLLIQASMWFMPLLFLISGMSTYYSLKKRSGRQYIRERISRLLVPFIFGLLFIVPPQAYYAEKFHNGYDGSYLSYLKGYFFDFSDLSGYFGSFTPTHLWFLLFLFILSLVILPVIIKDRYRKLFFISLFKKPYGILMVFLPVFIATALPLDIAGKNIVAYGLYMLSGYIMAADDEIIDMIRENRRKYLIISAAALVTMLTIVQIYGWLDGYTLTAGLFWALYVFTAWVILLAMLGYGSKYLNKGGRVLDYFSRAAFPVYILHQTYIVIFGYYIVLSVKGITLQFLLLMVSSFAASLVSYEVLRRFAVTRVLLGIK